MLVVVRIYNTGNSNTGGFAVISIFISNILAGNIDYSEYSLPATPDLGNYGSIITDPTVEGYNLIGICDSDNGDQCGLSNGINYDIVGSYSYPIDANLGPLAYNGGVTQTMALFPGSPAINNGNNPWSLFYDQRGSPHHRVECGLTDIGAYEASCRPVSAQCEGSSF